jgi:hypothetical protein
MHPQKGQKYRTTLCRHGKIGKISNNPQIGPCSIKRDLRRQKFVLFDKKDRFNGQILPLFDIFKRLQAHGLAFFRKYRTKTAARRGLQRRQ